MDQNVKFRFFDPKRHIFPRNGVFWRTESQNRLSGLGVASFPNPKKTNRVIFVGNFAYVEGQIP